MTLIIHLRNGDSVTVENFKQVRIFFEKGSDNAGQPSLEDFDAVTFYQRNVDQYNFIGEKNTVIIPPQEILYLETKSD